MMMMANPFGLALLTQDPISQRLSLRFSHTVLAVELLGKSQLRIY